MLGGKTFTTAQLVALFQSLIEAIAAAIAAKAARAKAVANVKSLMTPVIQVHRDLIAFVGATLGRDPTVLADFGEQPTARRAPYGGHQGRRGPEAELDACREAHDVLRAEEGGEGDGDAPGAALGERPCSDAHQGVARAASCGLPDALRSTMHAMRALGFASAAALGSTLLALSASGGCGGDAFTSGSNADASTGDGSSSGGGDDGMPSDGGDGPPMISGQTVYVATTGKNSNSGLDPQHPVATIKQGLVVAQGLADGGIPLPTVIVCSGTYAEDSLHLDFDASLAGGYDCTTNPAMWRRAPGYGFPTFDSKVASLITYANTTPQLSTFSIDGSISTKASVDGFFVAGGTPPASAPGPSLGLELGEGASPVLSNLVVFGGGGQAATTDAGSIGVRIGKGSAELKNCVVDGGSGKGPGSNGFGSIGVRITAGTPNIHDDVIAGGTGTGNGYSSVGVDVETPLTTAANDALAKLVVIGADAGATPTGSTIGVLARSATMADLDLVASVVYGSGSTGGTVLSVGVELDSGGTFTLLADRIGAGSQSQGRTVGVQVTSSAGVSIVNSEIHAGDVPVTASGSTRGVLLMQAVTKASIVFDTIYTGANGGQDGAAAIEAQNGVADVTIENDLLFGSGTTGSTGSAGAAVIAATCSGSGKQLASLDFTGFVNFTDLLYCNDTGQSNGLAAGITVALDGVAACTTTCGNVLVAGTCTTVSPSCQADPACPSKPPLQCVQSILGTSFSPTNDGFGASGGDAGIVSAAWQIEAPGDFCKLTKGAAPVAGITDDLLSHQRSTSTPTMGAVEYTGASCTM
jgi:hypothetical protein